MRLRRGSAAIAVAVLLAVQGCGSDDGSGGSTGGEASSAEAIPEAVASFEELSERPTQIPITEPLDAEITPGRSVYWLQCSIPACTQLGDVLSEAIDEVGWDLTIIDAGLSPETVKSAWEVAARDMPDYVIASGFAHAIYQDEIERLLDGGTTVVNIDITEEPLEGEYLIQGREDFERVGAAQADVAMAKTGEGGQILYVTSSTFENEVVRSGAFTSRVEELCESCEVEIIDIPASDIGTPDIAPRITSALRQNPDIEVVMLGIGDMAIGLPAALQAEGLADQAEVIVSAINPAVRQDIIDGTPTKVATVMETADMMWQAVDLLLRHDAGRPTDASLPPAQIWHVTEETAPEFDEPFNIVVDYQEQYVDLWGVG